MLTPRNLPLPIDKRKPNGEIKKQKKRPGLLVGSKKKLGGVRKDIEGRK